MSIFDEPVKITPEFLEAHGCSKKPMKNAVIYEYIPWQINVSHAVYGYDPDPNVYHKVYSHKRIRVTYQFLPEYESCLCQVVAEEWKSDYIECDPYVFIGDIPIFLL